MKRRILGLLGVRNPERRRRLRAVVLLAIVGVVAAVAGTALAVHDEGLFELDANVLDGGAAGDDWSNVFDGTADDADPIPVQTTFKTEAENETIFTGGGSKDYLGINNDPPADPWTDGPWQHKNGSVPDKDDISDAYAAAYIKEEDGVPHVFIYFGLDRLAVQGSADVGFWFLQGDVAPVAGGSFTGEHQVGDVLVLSEFSGGGTDIEIKVFEWVGTGGDEGGGTLRTRFGGATGQLADCDDIPVGTTDDNVCANVNTAPIPDADIPWDYVAKNGSRDMPTAAFFEGGIDLTDFVPGAGCVANFLAETRSSFEVNAVLKDFVHSQFELCGDKGGVKFHDLNADGDQDIGEPGLEGWTINLYNDVDNNNSFDSGTDTLAATKTTDANGAYSFPDLDFGEYIVCEDLQSNWFQSAPHSPPPPLPSGETLVENCPGNAQTPNTNGYAFTMGADNITGNDFGNFQQGTISGTKFKDRNDNGARNDGETGLSGWKIHVFNSAGTEVAGSPLTTDGSGNYSISLNPGTYTVCEEITDHAGWVQSYPTADTAGSTSCTALGPSLAARGWSVTVVSQGTTDLRDFGNTPLSKINVDFLPQAKLPDGTTDATHATSISCSPGGGNTNSNTFTSGDLRISQGTTITCTITYVDP